MKIMTEIRRNYLITIAFMLATLLIQVYVVLIYIPAGKVEDKEVKVETTIVKFGEVKRYKKSVDFKLIEVEIEANVDHIVTLNLEKDVLMLQKIKLLLVPIRERTDSINKKLQDKTIEIEIKKVNIEMYKTMVKVGEDKLYLIMEKETNIKL